MLLQGSSPRLRAGGSFLEEALARSNDLVQIFREAKKAYFQA